MLQNLPLIVLCRRRVSTFPHCRHRCRRSMKVKLAPFRSAALDRR
jgi:hypothetical protein